MVEIFIPLCKNSTNRYPLNILTIITLIYHMYIEYKLYNLSFNKTPVFLYDQQFISATMGNWDDHYTLKII